MKKEYSNGEVTIVWQPGKCIHSGICAKSLPLVFKPRQVPWVTPENSSSAEIIDTVIKCPSGALTYRKNSEGNYGGEK